MKAAHRCDGGSHECSRAKWRVDGSHYVAFVLGQRRRRARARARAQCTRTWIGPYVWSSCRRGKGTDTNIEPSVRPPSWGDGLPERQASDRCGDGERVRIEAERLISAPPGIDVRERRWSRIAHLEPCRVTRHERDVLCQIALRASNRRNAPSTWLRLDLDMKWSERFLRPRSRESATRRSAIQRRMPTGDVR